MKNILTKLMCTICLAVPIVASMMFVLQLKSYKEALILGSIELIIVCTGAALLKYCILKEANDIAKSERSLSDVVFGIEIASARRAIESNLGVLTIMCSIFLIMGYTILKPIVLALSSYMLFDITMSIINKNK